MKPSEIPSWIAGAADSATHLGGTMGIARDLIETAAHEVKRETDSWTNIDWAGSGAEGAVGLSEALHGLATNIVAEIDDGIDVANNYSELMYEHAANIDQWVGEWHSWNDREPVAGEPLPDDMLEYQEYMIGQYVQQAVDNDAVLAARMLAVMASLEESCALIETRINASMSVEDLVQGSVTILDVDAIVDQANDSNWDNPEWEEVTPEELEETIAYLEGRILTSEEVAHPSIQMFLAWRLGLGAGSVAIGNGLVAGNIELNDDGTLGYNSVTPSTWHPVAVAIVESLVDEAVQTTDWDSDETAHVDYDIERRVYVLRTYPPTEWGTADGEILGSQLNRLLDAADSGELSDIDAVVLALVLHDIGAETMTVEPDFTGAAAVFESIFAFAGIPAKILGWLGKALKDTPPRIRLLATVFRVSSLVLRGGDFVFDRYVEPHDPDLTEQTDPSTEPWEDLDNPEVEPPEHVDPDQITDNAYPPNPEYTVPPITAPENAPAEPVLPESGDPGPPNAHPPNPETVLPPEPDVENPNEYYELNPIDEIEYEDDQPPEGS